MRAARKAPTEGRKPQGSATSSQPSANHCCIKKIFKREKAVGTSSLRELIAGLMRSLAAAGVDVIRGSNNASQILSLNSRALIQKY